MKKSVLALLLAVTITIQPIGYNVALAAESDDTSVTETVTSDFETESDETAENEGGSEETADDSQEPADDEIQTEDGHEEEAGSDKEGSEDDSLEEPQEPVETDDSQDEEDSEGAEEPEEVSDEEPEDEEALFEEEVAIEEVSGDLDEDETSDKPFADESYDLTGSIVDDEAAEYSENAAELFGAQSSNNVKVNIPGYYYTESASKILAEINRIRKEACELGLIDPNTGKKLETSDYKPLVWSKDMESIARVRAAEANVNIAHTRPNGDSCFTVKSPWGEQAWGEDLAWNSNGSGALMTGIQQFYDEKQDYINKTQKGQKTGQTGHYESLISTRYTAIGVAAFAAEGEVYNWTAVAAELTFKTGLAQDKDSFSGKSSPSIEMASSYLTIGSVQGPDQVDPGKSASYSVSVSAQSKSGYGTSVYKNATLASGQMKWSSSDSSVMTIDSVSGRANAIKTGTATVKAAISGSGSKSKTVKVYSKTQSLSLDTTEATMVISGNTAPAIKLNSIIEPVSAASEIKWSSSNKKVAVVDNQGKVTAVGPGTVTITATSPDKKLKASCKISITRTVDELILTGKNTLNITSKKPQPSTTFKATIKPANASNKKVVWSSSNEDILKVSSKGKVTSTGKLGRATITAKADNGKVIAQKEVTVICRTEKIKVSPKSYKLGVGNGKKLAMSLKPALADKSKVEWSSSDPNVATVDYNGNVRGISQGTVVITARTTDGSGKKASCKIKVGKPVESIQLINSKKNFVTEIDLAVKKKYTVKALVTPTDAVTKKVTWASSDSSVATVKNGVISARKRGRVFISAQPQDGDNRAQVGVWVNVYQPVTGIKLSNSSLKIGYGKTAKINATVLPGDANRKDLVWSSSNTAVATVDQYGNVTVVANASSKKKTCVITAKATDGSEKKAKCTIKAVGN